MYQCKLTGRYTLYLFVEKAPDLFHRSDVTIQNLPLDLTRCNEVVLELARQNISTEAIPQFFVYEHQQIPINEYFNVYALK